MVPSVTFLYFITKKKKKLQKLRVLDFSFNLSANILVKTLPAL